MAIRVGIPINLLTYKPQQQTTALCWQVNLEVPILLDALDFEVEVDVVDTFDSINKKVYTKDNVVNYQNGTFFKSFVLDDAVLIENAQTYYWRVRVYNSYAESYWSDVQKQETEKFLNSMEYNKEFKVLNLSSDTPQYITIKKNLAGEYILNGATTAISEADLLTELTSYGITNSIYIYVGPQKYEVAKAFWYDDTELAERLLPDRYVYTKNGNTNIKRILEMYMRLIGVFKNEMVQVQNNYNYKKTQDKDLYDMLGVLLDYTSNTQEPMITYKYELLNLWQAYLHQGTIEAMNILFKALYGTEPKIEILKDIVDDKWTVYEQMKLLSIDGSTPSALTINRGDAFYNGDTNKIIIATENSDTGSWNNALEQEPNEMTTYQTQPEPPNTKGLCFTALTNNTTIYLAKSGNPTFNLVYSTNGSDWQTLEVSSTATGLHPIILQNNEKIYVKGQYRNQTHNDYINFYIETGQVAVSGNLYSIIDENNFENITDLRPYGTYLFESLFSNIGGSSNYGMIDASILQMPATILSEGCYSNMFGYCDKLENAPVLPATTLAEKCYYYMFQHCSTLNVAPQLPATTLAEYCYEHMFSDCSSLIQAPILPAINLADYCYYYMFARCSSLNYIKIYYMGNFNYTHFGGWVEGVSASGNFYYNGTDMTRAQISNNFTGIPLNWTINTFDVGEEPPIVVTVPTLTSDETEEIDLEIKNYYYDGTGFVEGRPDVKRYYIDQFNQVGETWTTIAPTDTTPYLYTNQYLASNLVLTVYNYYGIDVDQKILKQIVNNLKPLNVNITIIIINQANGYSYGLIDKYGNPVNYWGQRVIH